MSDGALFRHFASKDEIVLAAIDRVEEILFAAPPPDAEDPLARLRAFFERRLAVIRENPGVARLVTSDQLGQAAPPDGRARASRRSAGAPSRSSGAASTTPRPRASSPPASTRRSPR